MLRIQGDGWGGDKRCKGYMEKVWEVGDGVEDTGRRGSKCGDGP